MANPNRLRVTFNSPQSGYMSIGLKFGAKRFLAAMACEPYPSLEELMRALTAIAAGGSVAMVRWNEEPEEFDFQFLREGKEVQFEVVRFTSHQRADGKVVFRARGTVGQICQPFFETIDAMKRDLLTDEFARNWRREFPQAEFAKLAQAMGAAEN